MAIPIIATPSDRCPYPDGTKLTYWHFAEVGPVAHTRPDGSLYHGVAVTIAKEQVLPLSWHKAKPGERAIQILKPDGTPSGEYDAFMLAPVGKDEPQRWYAEGVDPRTL